MRKVPSWLSGALVLGTGVALLIFERRRPLRRKVESKLDRNLRNLAVAGISALALQITEKPLTRRLTGLIERRGWGLLKLVRLPLWLEVTLAVVLLDYTLYVNHVLAHKIPFLWRFHAVHHVDIDLDASTALRFHFAEVAISALWRGAQVLVIGVTPLSLSYWYPFVLVSILFHHSNVRLPIETERLLNRIIVTPRMHGIHHSIRHDERNSNWSGGFTIWDWLHGTLRLNVPQDEITIGVPTYRDPKELELMGILAMPFYAEPRVCELPEQIESPSLHTSSRSRLLI